MYLYHAYNGSKNSARDISEYLYKVFLVPGLLEWNVTCNSTLYQTAIRTSNVRIYPRTNISVSKEIRYIEDNQMNISINVKNLARYDDLIKITDFINNEFTDYNYSYGPNLSTTIGRKGYYGDSNQFNKTISGNSIENYYYKINSTQNYNYSSLNIIGIR